MAHLIDKSALVAEIERRISDNKKDIERASHKNLEDYFEGYEDALALLKQQYLDTLEVKEVQEELVSNDLEEAVKKYLTSLRKSHFEGYDIERAFKKGAKWQKEQMEKEVDLKKEFDDYTKDITVCDIRFEPFTHLHNCAKHFYELGKAQKGE